MAVTDPPSPCLYSPYMAVMDPPPHPPWSMGTADATLQLTVQFSGILIFSPAP